MLNEWLEVGYNAELKKQANAELYGMLSSVPTEDLRKLAAGTPIAKVAFFDEGDISPRSAPTFLDRFKGTPLFDQAIALEQESLQLDMLDQQKRQERRAENLAEDNVYDARDKLRLKKKLLELELAKSQAAPVPGEPAQGAGAPGPVPAEGVQDSSQGLQGGVAKMGAPYLTRPMIGGAIAGNVLGGAAGLAHGLRKDEQGNRHVLRGAAEGLLGAALGSHAGTAVGGIGPRMRQGESLATAAKGYATDYYKKPFQQTFGKGASVAAVKTGGVEAASAREKTAFAEALGRDLARRDMEKAANAALLSSYAERGGVAMTKMARHDYEYDGPSVADAAALQHASMLADRQHASMLVGRARRMGLDPALVAAEFAREAESGGRLGGILAGGLGGGVSGAMLGHGLTGHPTGALVGGLGGAVLGGLGGGWVGKHMGRAHGENISDLVYAHGAPAVEAPKQKLGSGMTSLTSLASKGLGMALQHPHAAGVALGAAGGAIAGGPEHRLSGALGGAALGHAAGGIGAGMRGGASLQGAARSYGQGMVNKAQGLLGGGGATAAPVTAASATHVAPLPFHPARPPETPSAGVSGGRADASVLGRTTPVPRAQVQLAAPDPMAFAEKDWMGRVKSGSVTAALRAMG